MKIIFSNGFVLPSTSVARLWQVARHRNVLLVVLLAFAIAWLIDPLNGLALPSGWRSLPLVVCVGTFNTAAQFLVIGLAVRIGVRKAYSICFSVISAALSTLFAAGMLHVILPRGMPLGFDILGLALMMLLSTELATTAFATFLLDRTLTELRLSPPEPAIDSRKDEEVAAALPTPPGHPVPAPLPGGPGQLVSVGGQRFAVASIDAIQAEQNYVRIHLGGPVGRSSLVRARISEVTAQIPDHHGFMVHRSWWLARHAIAQVTEEEAGALSVATRSGLTVPVARRRAGAFRDWWPAVEAVPESAAQVQILPPAAVPDPRLDTLEITGQLSN